MFKTNIIYYNNLTKILLNLEPCIAYISDFKNWNSFEDEQIIELKSRAKKEKLLSTIIVPLDSELNDAIWNEKNIVQKAEKNKIDRVLFYVTNPFVKETPDDHLYNEFNGMLGVRQIMVDDYFEVENAPNLNDKFFKSKWESNCIVVNNFNKKPSNDSIKGLLLENDFEAFEEETGLKYSFSGRVQEGRKVGRTLGFPTANIIIDQDIPLSKGVYAVKVYVGQIDKIQTFLGAACFWTNPNEVDVFEINILNFDQEIYGQKITVEPIQFLRRNKKVNSVDELKELLENDVKLIKDNFKA